MEYTVISPELNNLQLRLSDLPLKYIKLSGQDF